MIYSTTLKITKLPPPDKKVLLDIFRNHVQTDNLVTIETRMYATGHQETEYKLECNDWQPIYDLIQEIDHDIVAKLVFSYTNEENAEANTEGLQGDKILEYLGV